MLFHDDVFRLNGGEALNRHFDRARERAHVRRRPGTVDVDAFLRGAGLPGRRVR